MGGMGHLFGAGVGDGTGQETWGSITRGVGSQQEDSREPWKVSEQEMHAPKHIPAEHAS